LIDGLAERFGSQCTVVAIDALRQDGDEPDESFRVRTRSGSAATPLDARAWAAEAQRRGAGEILLTSIDRDGTNAGYDLPLLRAIRSAVSLPIVASGGAGSPADMVSAVCAGADAVLAAGIFHHGLFTIGQAKQALSTAGIPVRTEESC
jgi:cyclase